MNLTAGDAARLRAALMQAVTQVATTRGDGRPLVGWVDGLRILADPQALASAGRALAALALDAGADTVAGPVSAASPLVTAAVLADPRAGLEGRLVRRDVKAYGAGGRITSPSVAGRRVLVVDDVAATGASLVDAVAVLRSAGATVTTAACLVDRNETARARLREAGIQLQALFELSELTA